MNYDDRLSPQSPSRNWEAEEPAQPFPFLDYLQILWFRRKLILVITLFVTVIGYIQVSEIKNIYSATSTLMVRMPESQVVDIESVIARNGNYNDAEVEVEVLRSRGMAAKVIERLNLVNHPEFNPALREPEESLFDFIGYLDPRTWIPATWKKSLAEAMGQETEVVTLPLSPQEEELVKESRLLSVATNIFLSKMSLQQLEWTNVINITFSSLDPKLAQRVANEIPEAYIVDELESRFEATEKANAWLTEQLTELEKKVVDSERAVEIYREEYQLAAGPGMSILDTQISELNSQLIIARAELAEVEARLAQLRRLLDGGGQGVETASEVLASALVQQLRSQEALALSRASELSVEFGPRHPRMLQVQAELLEIRDRIRSEVGRIAIGLQHEVDFARTRVSSLESSLRSAQGETSEQNREAIQLRSLQREASANRTLYETFLNRFKETSSTQGLDTSDARVLSKAELPSGASYPNRKKMINTYFIAGLLGSCLLVLGLQFLNPGLTSPEQVQSVLGEYVIGLIPLIPGKMEAHDHVLEKPHSALVEALNSLKFSLALSDPDHAIKTVQITSSVPGEGKSTLAISLARVVASSNKKVILVDGDLRRPSVGKKLGLSEMRKGLSDLVVSVDSDISEFIQHDEKGQVDYLPTGTAQFANATDIFASRRMNAILDTLKERYDLVIVDTPPVLAVTDARIIGQHVDKTIFVVRWDKTPKKVIHSAMDLLRQAKVDIAGVVLQQVDFRRYSNIGYGNSGHYYQHKRYGKYYAS